MTKRMIGAGLSFVTLAGIVLNGCTFIVKDGDMMKYYGASEQRDKEYLNRVFTQQERVYQSQKSPEPHKAPALIK